MVRKKTVPRSRSASRVLLDLLLPFKWPLTGIFFLQLVSNGTALVQPLVASMVVEGVDARNDLTSPVTLLAGVATIGIVLHFFGSWAHGVVGERFVLAVRRSVARRLLGAQVQKIEDSTTGDILSRVSADTTLLQHTIVSSVIELVIVPISIVVAITLLVSLDPVLAVVVVTLIIVATAFEIWAFSRVTVEMERSQAYLGATTSVLQRVLLAFRTVKASRTERTEAAAFDEKVRGSYRAGVRAARTEAIADTGARGAVQLIFLLVLGIGAIRVNAGILSIGDLVAILLYVVYIQEPASSLVNAAARLSEGLAAAHRVDELLSFPQEPETVGPGPQPVAITRAHPPAPALRLDRVSFSYRDRRVLRDISLEAAPGLTVLVGPSGTGKTTLLSLIERFVAPTDGRILLDGEDIRHLDLADLRARVSYVEQEAPLMGDTIRAAASYGAPDVDDRRIVATLDSLGLTGWIASLPHGLDTTVGERGVLISGGQRQRLAIARALLRDTRVLLLDEATSQLDPPNQQVVLRCLTRHAADRLVIAVTHRSAMSAAADQVVFLDDGEVLAVGRHDTLLASNERYRTLLAKIP